MKKKRHPLIIKSEGSKPSIIKRANIEGYESFQSTSHPHNLLKKRVSFFSIKKAMNEDPINILV
jgi:hypothetical protein